MKNIFYILLLLPTIIFAQYPSNSGQKITLGEQTTADGLVFRGVANIDTVTATSKITRANKQDTSAFLLLDTVTNLLWHYKTGSNGWIQAGGSTLDTATMLLPYWRSGRFSGVLPVANGGTNITTFTAANRIPYASSATALTTTNKFTFDPTGNKLIIGKNDSLDSNPNFTINLSGSDEPSPILGFRLYNTTLNKVSLFRYDNNHSFIFMNNDSDNGLGSHRFKIGSGNGEEILTITRPTASGTDGRVGIGTVSPNYKLDISGTVNTSLLALRSSTNPSSNNYVGIDFGTGNFNGSLPNRSSRILGFADGGNDAIGLSFYTSNAAAPTEKMRIDKSGNVGIGVTPSAWDASAKVLQIGNFVALANYTDYMDLSTNTFYDGQYKYLNSSRAAATYTQTGGQHRFYIAPSGTAGNPITFTQAMTLGSNNGLSIGTTTAASANGLLVAGAATFSNTLTVNSVGGSINLIQSNLGAATYYVMQNTIETGGKKYRFGYTGGSLDKGSFSIYNETDNILPFLIASTGAATFSGSVTANSLSLGTPLAVANGGTGNTSLDAADIVTKSGTQTIGGAKTFSSSVTGARFDPTSSSVTGTGMYLPSAGKLGFSISNNQKMNLVSNGIGFGTDLFAWISGLSFTLDFPQFAISSGANGGGLLMSNFYINSSNQRIYKTTNGATFINTQAGAIAFSTAPSGTINEVATFNPISLYLENDGRVAIGSTTLINDYKLTIQDSVYVGGRVSAAGYTTRSDYDLKDEIQSLNYGLKEVIKMQPVKYTYKSNGEQQLGFIAQDIGTLIPESVHFDSFMGVDYQSIIPILTKAIQEQNALIKALEQRLLILENK